MSTDTVPQYTRGGIWGGGAVAAIVAGLAMGLVMHFGAGLIELLGGLAPVPGESVVWGWTIHLLISVAFGLAFAVCVSRAPICQQVRDFTDLALAGVAYGAFIGVVAGGVVFPVAMTRADVATLPLPFLPLPGAAGELVAAVIFAIGHLVYGLVLGVTFATINGLTPAGRFERFAVLD
ncbi:hypothetical protein Halru_2374 [Halovivax ruber XH-70]|uniref:Uncharacterized protein n=1 Tax=Halovivax ruber (strain DSM 18193 / JCM 13892 / XH-70) TaxID=797302 RepID=L0IDX5_HALRX|nr:hypothetical protein [Halovivax ruber]AGB16959.1 hypothetical protein Halru_2374 [Halovivax ruber XH-70]